MRRILLLILALIASMPAAARDRAVTIAPYLEVQEVIDVPLNHGGGDTLTYTTLAAGVDASVRTRHAEASLSYRYERRIPNNHSTDSGDVHSGLARARLDVAPGVLSLEGGAIATRARDDIRGPAPNTQIGNPNNVTQVYGIYAGPTLSTHAGALDIGASAQVGYVKVEDKTNLALAPGQPKLDAYDSATNVNATASVGMAAGLLPFGWTVSGGYQREDAHQLDQRFEGKYVRGDVTLPVSPTLALTAGAGYEKIVASQRDPLRDAAGNPVTDNGGHFVTDPDSPRKLAYKTDGFIYDAGVIWKPSKRTQLEARGGYRYGGTFYQGSFTWQMSRTSGLQIGVYNRIDSFGRSLTRNLAALPTSFSIQPGTDLTGCIVGNAPGTGACLNDSFQSLNDSNFRSRGVFALYSAQRGPWSMSLGGGYTQRKYLAPVEEGFFSLNGVTDDSYEAQASVSRKLSRQSGVTGTLYADWYKSGIPGSRKVTAEGGTLSYYHLFGERLSANASLGIFASDQDGFETDVNGTALVGMRYQF